MLLSLIVCLAMLPLQGEFPICEADGYQGNASLVWDGRNYLVAWTDRRTDTLDIWGRIVTLEGTFIDTNFAICTAIDNQYAPHISSDGTNFLITWMDERNFFQFEIWGQLVDSCGSLIDTNFAIAESTLEHIDNVGGFIGCDNSKYFVVWTGGHLWDYDIWGQIVDSSGVLIGSNFPICTLIDYQQSPRVAWGNSSFLVVWHDLRNGTSETWGQFIAEDGAFIDTNFYITSGLLEDVAYNGNRFLVVYKKENDIWGKFIEPPPGIEETSNYQFSISNYQLSVYPNPLTTTTTITFTLPSIGHSAEGKGQRAESIGQRAKNIELRIYDVAGRLVKSFSLGTGHWALGTAVYWDGKDSNGIELKSGIYFVTLHSEEYDFEKTEKILKLK